jgi:clan AA aspartic protease
MGITTISATVSNLDKPEKKIVATFMVDTGAAYTVLPREFVKKLHLTSVKTQDFGLADGTVVTRRLGHAMIEIDGDRSPSTVVLGEPDDSALIGVITLENMGLMVDPFKRKLRPMRLMLA